MPLRVIRAIALGMASLAGLAAPGTALDADSQSVRSIVVTTEVLGSVVDELVGVTAEVKVLMPAGTDPHTWQPSARDTEAVFGAGYVVANGLGLEQGLVEVLEQATADGVPVFRATDHIALREEGEDEHEAAGDHDHEVGDPHFWLDPMAMRDVVAALGAALAEAGFEVGASTARLSDELLALDEEVASILAVVPQGERKLVTGHDSLGYFADRYGFKVVGTVVPGQDSSLEPSARALVELIDVVRSENVPAVFAEVATPQSVARVVADEAGARLLELDVAQLPEGGSYADFMRGLAQTIATALAPQV